MPLPETYASAAELAAYWRTLSADEASRATTLLGYAAGLINELPGAADADGNAAFSATTCKHVSLDMVKRAMLGGGGVASVSQSMADMSADVRYVNPVGNLYLSAQERRRLTGSSPAAFSLIPESNVRVPGTVWNSQPSSQTGDGAD